MQPTYKIMFEGDYVIYLMWYARLCRYFLSFHVNIF